MADVSSPALTLKHLLLWTPAVLQMAFIFAASSVPGSELPAGVWDKLAHFLVYAALGAFFVLPLAGGRMSRVTMLTAGSSIVLSFLYGLSDEVHQMFTPGRSPDILDVVADTAGAAAGSLTVFVFAAIWRFIMVPKVPGGPRIPAVPRLGAQDTNPGTSRTSGGRRTRGTS